MFGGEKIRKLSKIFAGIIPLLLLMTAVSAPLALADSGSCTSCGSQGSCPTADNITVTTENLEGFEELRAVIGAWKNEDTRLLMKELIRNDYCTPRLPKSEAQEVTLYKDGKLLSQSTRVKIPFRTHGKGLDAQIMYRDNGTFERVYATVSGSASVLEKPMEILKENAKYQAIVENLEEQGYEVKEESAQVVKTYTPADYALVPSCIEDEVWNTAIITVKATKGDQVKITEAFVCIDKSRVLIITDFWCEIGCQSACIAGTAAACAYAPAYCPYIMWCFTNYSPVTCCDVVCGWVC